MPKIDAPENPITPQLSGLHLFHFDGAPCAQRVRFALGEKGLARGREVAFDSIAPQALAGENGKWVSRVVSLAKKAHVTPAYAQIHLNMVVPALVHDADLYLESMDIIEYLDNAFGGARLAPEEPTLRAATMERVEQAKVLHLSIRYVSFHWGLGRLAMLNAKEQDKLKYLASNGPDGENLVAFYDGYSNNGIPREIFDGHLQKLYAAFEDVDAQLVDGRKFLMSDDVTIADAFWCMKILRLIEFGYPFAAQHPQLFAWFKRMESRPSFQSEVIGNNRMNHRFFVLKARIDKLFGGGIESAVRQLAA